jgi:hypothetical protein
MEKFNFYLDQKVTTWMRTEIQVEAESLEESIKKVVDIYQNQGFEDLGWEELDGVKEKMDIEENDGFSTEEIYHEDGQFIYMNGK